MQDKITVNNVSSVKKEVEIYVSPETVDNKFTEFFDSVKNQVQVKGYRKGKAPVKIIKQQFSEQARPVIAKGLFSEFYTQALQEHEISPVGNPSIDGFKEGDQFPGLFGFDQSYKVKFSVEVLPSVKISGYKNLKLNNMESGDIDATYENIMNSHREQFAQKIDVSDRGAKNGDSLIMDFTGYLDGNPFEGGKAEGFQLPSLGEGSFIPGFEEQLVGMNPGDEKKVKVTFPEDYKADFLAGKEAEFDVKLHKIIETKLAEVDEDLAMMVGFETIDDLKSNVRSQAEDKVERTKRAFMEQQISEELIKLNEFDVPKTLLDSELKRLIGQNQHVQLPNNAVEALRNAATANVKRAIIFDAIYSQEDDIEIAPEELDELLETYAKQHNKTKDEIVSMLHNSGQMDAFMGVLKAKKAVDFIIENANFANESEEDNE